MSQSQVRCNLFYLHDVHESCYSEINTIHLRTGNAGIFSSVTLGSHQEQLPLMLSSRFPTILPAAMNPSPPGCPFSSQKRSTSVTLRSFITLLSADLLLLSRFIRNIMHGIPVTQCFGIRRVEQTLENANFTWFERKHLLSHTTWKMILFWLHRQLKFFQYWLQTSQTFPRIVEAWLQCLLLDKG